MQPLQKPQKRFRQKNRIMIVLTVEEYRKNRYKVCMDDGTHLILYKGEVRHYSIKEGMELPADVYKELFYEVVGKRAKKRALYLLEKMDRTEKGLTDKLRENEYPKELIDEAVAYVKRYHYIDDMRYAKNYISYHQTGRSRARIRQELMRKGIPTGILDAALEESYADSDEEQELIMIAKLLEKKGYDPLESDIKQKQKIYGYLMRKGFRSDDILRAMKSSDYLT